MIDWIDNLFGLPHGPEHGTFTPAVRFLIIVSFIAMLATVFNALMLVLMMWLLKLVYNLKKETLGTVLTVKNLLQVVKEWVGMAKTARQDAVTQGEKVQNKVDLLISEVHKVPEIIKEVIPGSSDSVSTNPSVEGKC